MMEQENQKQSIGSRIKVFVKQKTTQDQHSPRMHRNRAALARSRSIDHQIDDEREKKKNEVQLLILGGASSGKSTFTKQLRLHHGDGFPAEARAGFRLQICDNLTDALNTVIDQMTAWGVEFSSPENQDFASELKKKFPSINYHALPSSPTSPSPDGGGGGGIVYPPEPVLSAVRVSGYFRVSDYSQQILALWRDTGVQHCFNKRLEFYPKKLYPAEEYVLQNIERIMDKNYIPSIQDVLYVRCPTVGVDEHYFTANGLTYRVIDVAGQKNQRKKWIHFFEGVTAVIFFVALSGYCENLEEAPSLNSLEDSLNTYSEVKANKFLEHTDFVLFLNKKDVFDKRLKHCSLKDRYPAYKGKSTEEAISFIKDKFIQKSPCTKQNYIHVSCAIDPGLMKTLIGHVMDIIVETNLKKSKQML